MAGCGQLFRVCQVKTGQRLNVVNVPLARTGPFYSDVRLSCQPLTSRCPSRHDSLHLGNGLALGRSLNAHQAFQRRELLQAGKGGNVPRQPRAPLLFPLNHAGRCRSDYRKQPGRLMPEGVRVAPGFTPKT